MDIAIHIQQLSFSYPDGKTALEEINLTVKSGEKIAIVGANGAGKSTLLNHLNGILFDAKAAGKIEIMGKTLEKKNLSQIRALVGLVFQDPNDQLFSTTVYQDVAYGPIYQGLTASEIDIQVIKALEMVEMSGYIKRNSYHLSIGEKKRVAIATVLSMDPQILVLDEPTAGLDPRARRNLIALMGKLPQTMIIASHDLDLVRNQFPRTILMNEGRIVCDDSTENILGNELLLLENGL